MLGMGVRGAAHGLRREDSVKCKFFIRRRGNEGGQ